MLQLQEVVYEQEFYRCERCGQLVFFLTATSEGGVCDDCLEKFDRCASCRDWFLSNEMVEGPNDSVICSDCSSECVECNDCGASIWKEDGVYIRAGSYVVCPSCAVDYVRCYHCDELVDYSDTTTVQPGMHVCLMCIDDRYARCDNCYEWVETDDALEGRNGRYCCDNCLHVAEPRINRIHNYSYKPYPVFHGPEGPYFGMELETDNFNDAQEAADALELDESSVYMKHDGSLHEGIEFVFHPRNLESWQEHQLQSLTRAILAQGGRSYDTSTCGVHVHRSRADLSDIDEAKLIVLFVKCQPQIEKVAQRQSNNYASYSLGVFASIDGIEYKVKTKRHAWERYQAINFTNTQTIEFRVFKGTLVENTLKAYLEFSSAITEYAKLAEISILLSLDGNEMWEGFVSFVAGSQKYGLLWNYLQRKGLACA